MSGAVVRVRGLGKRYRIGARQGRARYKSLREVLATGARSLVRRRRRGERASARTEFWALRDINFELSRGEVLGIIGRNGSGKSTLLKVLAGITEPTEGEVELHGQVGSLLEVGTGFHPELTGRENIFLNGAILGMRNVEIKSKLDEIVDFAEIEQFLDTPVKRFSTGMYMRLAFSVAAHLEPEILVVDEVLAVGDAEFQQKCLGKIHNVAEAGRTVLFVSHNMASVQSLCSRVLLLRDGHMIAEGDPPRVIQQYFSDVGAEADIDLRNWPDRIGTGEAHITRLQLLTQDGQPLSGLPAGGNLRIRIHAEFPQPTMNPTFGVVVHTSTTDPLLDARSPHAGMQFGRLSGSVVVETRVDNLWLYPGTYLLSVWIMDSTCRTDIDFVKLCCVLQVHASPGPYGDLRLDPTWGRYWVPSSWSAVEQDDAAIRAPYATRDKQPSQGNAL